MFRKLIAPICVSVLAIAVLTIIGLNYEALAKNNEAEQNYFIKPIPTSQIVIVEPNYGHFYNPNPEIDGDTSGEVLYSSLEELQKTYEIKKAEMVRFERKGKMIPNLYVYVNPLNSEIANRSISSGNQLAENF